MEQFNSQKKFSL